MQTRVEFWTLLDLVEVLISELLGAVRPTKMVVELRKYKPLQL